MFRVPCTLKRRGSTKTAQASRGSTYRVGRYPRISCSFILSFVCVRLRPR